MKELGIRIRFVLHMIYGSVILIMDWFKHFRIVICKFGYLCFFVNTYGFFFGIFELLESDRIYILYFEYT